MPSNQKTQALSPKSAASAANPLEPERVRQKPSAELGSTILKVLCVFILTLLLPLGIAFLLCLNLRAQEKTSAAALDLAGTAQLRSKKDPVVEQHEKNVSILSGIKALSSAERKALLKFLKNPQKMPENQKHRQLLLDIADNYKSLEKFLPLAPQKEREFIEACFASPILLFQLPKEILRTDMDYPEPLKGIKNEFFQLPYKGFSRDQMREEFTQGTNSFKKYPIPGSSDSVWLHSGLHKDIRRVYGPMILVQNGKEREVENLELGSKRKNHLKKIFRGEDPKPKVQDSDVREKAELIDAKKLTDSLKGLSSMQGQDKAHPLIQAQLCQLGYGLPKGHYQSLVMSLFGSAKLTVNYPPGSDPDLIITKVHDISPRKIAIEYQGKCCVQQIELAKHPDVYAVIGYKTTQTFEKNENGAWIDTVLDYHSSESVSFSDNPLLFKTLSQAEKEA